MEKEIEELLRKHKGDKDYAEYEFDEKILRAFKVYKDLEKKMRDSVYTTEKELKEEGNKYYYKRGFLERKMKKLSENEDENEDEIDKIYDRISVLSLKEEDLRLREKKYYDKMIELGEIKEKTLELLSDMKNHKDYFFGSYKPDKMRTNFNNEASIRYLIKEIKIDRLYNPLVE
jgi:hypothetical protein